MWFIILALVFTILNFVDFYTIYLQYGSDAEIIRIPQKRVSKRGSKQELRQEKDSTKKKKHRSRYSSFHRCCPCCPCLPRNNKYLECIGDGYWNIVDWYKTHFGVDSYNWFVVLLLREVMEIIFQVFAAYNYNGINVLDANQTTLGYQEFEVKLFCVLLSMNSLCLGVMWIFYLVGYQLCHGDFFKHLIFVIDTLFDTFYALFPIIVVTSRSQFNLQVAVGTLQTSTVYVLF